VDHYAAGVLLRQPVFNLAECVLEPTADPSGVCVCGCWGAGVFLEGEGVEVEEGWMNPGGTAYSTWQRAGCIYSVYHGEERLVLVFFWNL